MFKLKTVQVHIHQVELILIASHWLRCPWFSMLRAVGKGLPLPLRLDLLSQGSILHPQPQLFQLTARRLKRSLWPNAVTLIKSLTLSWPQKRNPLSGPMVLPGASSITGVGSMSWMPSSPPFATFWSSSRLVSRWDSAPISSGGRWQPWIAP